MDPTARDRVTQILLGRETSPHEAPVRATDELFEIVYDELRAIAGCLMRGAGPGHTLRPTALVHETYLKLVDASRIQWQSRAHFLRTAARAMRQVLIDYARSKQAQRRGGGARRVTLDEQIGGKESPIFQILALDDALGRLSRLDERVGRVVELRIFAGMNMDEIAHVLVISRRTAYDDWDLAKRWLARELASEPA